MQKLFIDFEPNGKVILNEEQSRHISKSLRMKIGDMLTLSCGNGRDYGCIIDAIDSKSVTLSVCYEQANSCEPTVKVKLYQGVPKGDKLEDIIQQMVGSHNRVINEAEPIADTRLSDGSRVNVVLPPVALNGPVISIRKFPKNPILMKQMITGGSVSQECADFLKILVRAGYNIFISGGTGSGKTTFLNALSEFIPKNERVITIEDSAELQIRGIANLVRMETRKAGPEGTLAITIRELIRTALRMRPDRIIVGEIRGAECLDMLQAMNTGHLVRASYRRCCQSLHMIIRQRTNARKQEESVCSSMQNIYRQVSLPV